MKNFFVHPASVVDKPCSIGDGVKIWHFCHVSKNASIGKNSVLGQNCYVGPGVRIGDGVKIQNNVSVYDGVEIEDRVFLGPSCVLTNVMNPRAHVERKDEFRKTLVREGASVGANATIVCGVTLGRYSFVGAGSVVTRDVPDYAMVYGVPARQQGWMCACGEKLPKPVKNRASCKQCGEKYRLKNKALARGI